MKQITFCGSLLIIDDKKINIDEFKNNIPDSQYSITDGKKVHIYEFSYVDNYLCITFGDGSAMPRNPSVIDIDTNEQVPNPRQPNQVETRETFGIIDFDTSLMWLSSLKKKSSLLSFFRSKFPKTSVIISKDIYNEEEFISLMKRLDEIKISASPNLFSKSSTISDALEKEIYGYEADIATLKFEYQGKSITQALFKKIKEIFTNKMDFNTIVISGRDERNFGMLFNSEGFTRKIEFKAIVDENEMFDTRDVFQKLIGKIKDENN